MDRAEGIKRLDHVRVELWCPRGPEINWVVVRAQGTETLSEPYSFDLDLACDDPSVEAEAMLGADVELLFDRNGLTRMVYGIIVDIELELSHAKGELDGELDGLRARVRIAPAFHLLAQEIDTRFFLGQSVIEVLSECLGQALAPFGRSLDAESRIRDRYERRDYCVQFRESTFDFCRRLMAEEGIAYMFEPDHDAQRERLVLVDGNDAYAPAELLVPGALPLAANHGEELDRESLQRFDWRHRRRPNRVLTQGYNPKLPTRPDEGEAEARDEHHHRARAHHHHGLRRQIIDDPIDDPTGASFTGAELQQQATHAALLLQRHRVEASSGHGESNAIGFCPGTVFELDEAQARALAGGEHELLLVRVTHDARLHEGGSESEHDYHNHFQCSPRATAFRPPEVPGKPRVSSVLTGVVVGPSADEVHCDALGRVKVQLHGDRHGQRDEHSSCWIRVAQAWAGPGYGTMVIPRVGMEVVVAFVDGDPDRPLITGCVYNGDNTPPAPLPDAAGESVFKSSSTPGGSGFSELRVDDSSGQVLVRAQGRMDLHVGGNHYETTMGGREVVIGSGHPTAEQDPDDVSHNMHVHNDRNLKLELHDYMFTAGRSYHSASQRFEHFFTTRSTVAEHGVSVNTAEYRVETSRLVSHKSNEVTLAASNSVSVKGGRRIVLESNNKLELKVGQSFISIGPDRIDIHSPQLRLNSGGQVGEARDGEIVEAFEQRDPLLARPAATGARGGGGGGGGGGGPRQRRTRRIGGIHAPPMVPPPLRPNNRSGPGSHGMQGDRQLTALAWSNALEAWCSEPVKLEGEVDRSGPPQAESLDLILEDNGKQVARKMLELPGGTQFEWSMTITNVYARAGLGERTRNIHARAGDLRTQVPLQLHFITELPEIRYQRGRARFHISVRDGRVHIGGLIPYTPGWLHYVIHLGDHVPASTGGRINKETARGPSNWRYCKRMPGSGELVFWDGQSWVPVPNSWKSPLGTKLLGNAVWMEGDRKQSQHGNLIEWPDPIPPWSAQMRTKAGPRMLEYATLIAKYWSGKFELKRRSCLSEYPECCRLEIVCKVEFAETDTKRRGIIFAENDSRANASAWSLVADEDNNRAALHEFGHHLGNPDEYEGASSVDPSVNGDGAVAGIDEYGLMGKGDQPRRRYFTTVAAALSELIETHTGKQFTYDVVDPLP